MTEKTKFWLLLGLLLLSLVLVAYLNTTYSSSLGV